MMGLEGLAQVDMVKPADHTQTQGAGGEEVGKLGEMRDSEGWSNGT